jgi:ATP-binding cassette subfamily B protein
LTDAVSDARWQAVSLLDASTRMVAELVGAGGLRAGTEAARVLETIAKRARSGVDPALLVPENFWFAVAGDSDDTVVLRGAVLLRVRGRRDAMRDAMRETSAEAAAANDSGRTDLAPPLVGTPTANHRQPLAEMWRLVADKRPSVPALIALGLIVAAAGALFEVMWLRGVLEINNVLSLREQRLATLAMLAGFIGGLMLLDMATTSAVLAIGRRVETRLRAALLEKLPHIGENYFRSRLVSDLAHRAHNLDALRGIPDLGARFARTSLQLVFTALALAWLDPSSTGVAVAAAALGIAIPLATERLLAERELRQRSHEAALTRHYLDGLIGLVPARMHSAERALRHQHEQLLVEWGRSSLHLLRGAVVVEGLQLLVGSLLAAWLVLGFASRGARPGSTLLLVYWTLTLPMLGRELASIIRQFPAARNILARILEPLDAPDESLAPEELTVSDSTGGTRIELKSVAVNVRGRRVLAAVDLTIEPGEHVAIVGRSGAGKSTLAGLPLGWRVPSAGTLLIDGEPLDRRRLAELRRATAWVDPAVHLWNRSLFDNLRYGDRGTIVSSIGSIIEEADLSEILQKLPSGLQSPLGEAGRLTSGGEGQRIRFGRALVRRPVRLAILDEPFRGLDRHQRHELLVRARTIWRDQTMLCVTHDIRDTLAFERVLVMDEGRIVEDGDPVALSQASHSLYAQLLAAERAVQTDLWGDGRFRRWRLAGGVITEAPENGSEQPWTAERHVSRGR